MIAKHAMEINAQLVADRMSGQGWSTLLRMYLREPKGIKFKINKKK